jgi:gamma-glutamyl hercynylcysteine S-oxide synthase
MIISSQSQDHKIVYNKDIDILIEVEALLSQANEKNVSEYKDLINIKVMELLYKVEHPVAAENIFGMCLAHPNTFVRYRLIDLVEKWLPYFSAIETIINLTHDPDDLVSFKAMEVCARQKLEQSIPYLTQIIGDPAENFTNPGKPVGLGAQKVLDTMLDIFGVESQEELVILKEYFDQKGVLKNNYNFEEKIPEELLESFYRTEEEGMILIPGGFFSYGLNEERVPDKSFDWRDSVPEQKVWLPPYFIDKYPVTNLSYDEFTDFIDEHGHIFCHPNEPDNKQHRRNTYWDDRFKKDHPVSGIDFYDAFAFARWKGKELPTEFQWEKAARGEDGTVWPWGNIFEPSKLQYSGSLYEKDIDSLEHWRKTLLKAHSDSDLSQFTINADVKVNTSSYGVVGMVGNTWEWTRSDFKTRRIFSPSFKDYPIKGGNLFAVLKGGSFYSHPGLMFPSFRGKDIPFCRHNEMGFRCVKNIPIHLLRSSLNQPITNKAIY